MIRLTFGALTLAAALALPAMSQAQQTQQTQQATPPQHHHFAHALFRNVNVTQDERAQFRTIHQKYAPQIKAARQANDRASVRNLRSEQLDEMRAALTPDQQQTFDANRAALRARAQQRQESQSTTPAPQSAPAPQSTPAPQS